MKSKNEELKKSLTQIVVFLLGEERYGIKISQVKEISLFPKFTAIPNSPDYVLGLVDLRGEVIILLDLEKKFHLTNNQKEKQKQHFIVCKSDSGKLGIVVDKVEGIIEISREEVKETDDLIESKISAEFFSGVIVHQDQVMVILDASKLLADQEIKRLHKKNT